MEHTHQSGESSAIALSISFIGPLVFDFIPQFGGSGVIIYAPYCPYHVAGLFSSIRSYSETDLWKCLTYQNPEGQFERAYRINGAGISRNSSKPTVIGPSNSTNLTKDVLRSTIQSLPGSKSLSPPKDKILFKFWVPTPQFVFPLYIDKVEIVDGYDTKPNDNKIAPYCTGLRFFYSWDGGTPINIILSNESTRDITPPVFAEVPASADIQLRYEGLGLTDENDPHSDSRSCFASTTMLVGAESWLNYGDGRSSPSNRSCSGREQCADPDPCGAYKNGRHGAEIHSGADCHAPIIVNGLM
ncbi:MAG TPA: hypothetical protein VGI45_23055 [Terracidiphilus sp.]|jgi:hypothetical protein